jgi:hypothetical protein
MSYVSRLIRLSTEFWASEVRTDELSSHQPARQGGCSSPGYLPEHSQESAEAEPARGASTRWAGVKDGGSPKPIKLGPMWRVKGFRVPIERGVSR